MSGGCRRRAGATMTEWKEVLFMSVSHDIVRLLPYLRRYARALTGSQETGDQYVRLCLEAILAEPERIKSASDLRVELFAVFHDAWDIVDSAIPLPEGAENEEGLHRQLAALPSIERQVLLLIALERFSTAEAARILDLDEADVVKKLDVARQELRRQATTRVLIIEDEPVIAMDIAGIVESLGHEVVGVAARQAEAVELARKHQPGLVLADVQLQDGDSGIVTVQEIMRSMDAPVIFVTGFPERLLTGDRVEPAFIVTKPFDPETLKVAIVQALSFSAPQALKPASAV
jgi:CheY-like chemotaxis protein/DNA-directed RNA polymerase specialized sigma24 family protein